MNWGRSAKPAIAVSVAIILLVCASGASAAPSSRILFARNQAPIGTNAFYSHDIFSMWPTGSHLRQFTSGGANDVEPAWSPGRGWLVFARLQSLSGRRRGLYKVRRNLTGLALIPHTRALKARSPDWSADGRKIAFVGRQGSHTNIYTIHPDGTHLRNLTQDPQGNYGHPSWSPDSRWLVFDSRRGGPGKIESIKADGTHRDLEYHNFQLEVFGPSWSPDGQDVVFSARHRTADASGLHMTDLYRIHDFFHTYRFFEANVTHESIVTCSSPDDADCEIYNTDPAWSPNSRDIAYTRATSGAPETSVYRIRLDGTHKQSLIDGNSQDPDWAAP